MRDAVIVEAVRTPVGRRGGALSERAPGRPVGTRAASPGRAYRRSTRALVDDVIWGCVSQVGEQTFNVGRSAVLAAGWPESVPGVTVDRQCGSSQQSVHFAAAGLVSGQYDVVVAGGVESMSRVTLGSSAAGGLPFGQTVLDRYAEALAAAGTPFFNQGVGAELIAARWGQTREQLDTFALESHDRAAAATDSGAFEAQIAPVTLPDGTVVSLDEGIRRGGTLGGPVRPEDPVQGGRAGHRRLVVPDLRRGRRAAHDDLREGGRARPAPAGPRAHRGAGRRRPGDDADGSHPGDAQGPAALRVSRSPTSGRSRSTRRSRPCRWPGWPRPEPTPSRLNVHGGAIALGHPLGGSGARLMTTLVHHLRDSGTRTACRRCARAAGWPTPRSSSGSDPASRPGRQRR